MRPGISSETLARAGVAAVPAEQAEALCGLATEGLFIPYRALNGAPLLDGGKPYGRLRLQRPLESKKYHQAFGSRVHAFLPPGLADVPRGSDLFVIEGEFKSLSLMEAGFAAVGVSGFFGFAMKGGDTLVPEFIEVLEQLAPARVFFCGDSDTALNYQFAFAAVRLARLVAPVPVLLPRIPYAGPGKGADDCRETLGAEFPNWWRGLLNDAVPVGPGTEPAPLAVKLFQREEAALIGLEGDARAKAEARLVKLAAALDSQMLQQDRVVTFAERKFGLRRSVFKKAVEAAVKEGIRRSPCGFDAFYDPARKAYWIANNRGEFIEVNESALCLHLEKAGFTRAAEKGSLSLAQERLIEIQRELDVVYAGPLAGHAVGLQEMCGQRVLVTRAAKLVRTCSGACPNIDALLSGLLADPEYDQVSYVLGWLKVAYEALAEGKLRHGQMLALAGPKDCGKSLLQNLITEVLGGRAAKPYRYMCGGTEFNGDLFCAEHLMIEDEVALTDIRARRHFGSRIKDFTVNTVQSCHGKNRQAISLKPFWRVSISLNDEPENLLILPPIDESLEDKIILLKAYKNPMPMETATLEGRQQFMATLIAEVPAFLHRLVNFTIPVELKSERFGITHFHHPELLAALSDMSPEMRLLTLIDALMEESEEPGPWIGSSADLERMLFDGKHSHEARRLLDWNNATGTYLGRLAKKFPQRIHQVRTQFRRDWVIKPANWTQFDTATAVPDTLE
jgi:hypothetical protein